MGQRRDPYGGATASSNGTHAHNGHANGHASKPAKKEKPEPSSAEKAIEAGRIEKQRENQRALARKKAEALIVGACLMDASFLSSLNPILPADFFQDHEARSAYSAALDTLAAHNGVPLDTVARVMAAHRGTRSDGLEHDTLARWKADAPSPAAARIEADTIIDEEKKRKAIAEIDLLLATQRATPGGFKELVNKMQATFGVSFMREESSMKELNRTAPPKLVARTEEIAAAIESRKSRFGNSPGHDAVFALDQVFPPWFVNYAEACSRCMKASLELAVQGGLACLSSHLGPWFLIAVKRGWTAPMSMWTIGVLSSGGKKSHIIDDMWAARYFYRKELMDHRSRHKHLMLATQATMEQGAKKMESDAKELQEEIDRLAVEVIEHERAAKAAKNEDEVRRHTNAARTKAENRGRMESEHQAKLQVIAGKRYAAEKCKAATYIPKPFASSPTPESIPIHAAISPGNYIGIVDAEGDIFKGMGRYSDGSPNIAVFLEAYDGKTHDPMRGNLEEHHKTNIHIGPRTVVDLHMMIQNAEFAKLGDNEDQVNKGFLNRFLFFLAEGMEFGSTKEEIADDIRAAYIENTRRPYMDSIEWGLRAPADRMPHAIHMTAEARDTLMEWQNGPLKHKVESAELCHLQGWANKFPTMVAKLSLVIEYAWHLENGGRIVDLFAPGFEVSKESVDRAIYLGEFFAASAVVAFHTMRASSTEPEHDAKMVLLTMREFGKAKWTLTDIVRACAQKLRSRYINAGQLKRALERLVRDGHLDCYRDTKIGEQVWVKATK